EPRDAVGLGMLRAGHRGSVAAPRAPPHAPRAAGCGWIVTELSQRTSGRAPAPALGSTPWGEEVGPGIRSRRRGRGRSRATARMTDLDVDGFLERGSERERRVGARVPSVRTAGRPRAHAQRSSTSTRSRRPLVSPARGKYVVYSGRYPSAVTCRWM